MSDIGGYVPGGSTCPTTGKKSWQTRRDAKKVARRANPGEHMSAFWCADCDGFHLGHLPGQVRRGIAGRETLR